MLSGLNAQQRLKANSRCGSHHLRFVFWRARLGVTGKYSRPRERPEPAQLGLRIFELTPRGCVQFSADEGPDPARAQGQWSR
jgi:hypothetical protein